MLHSSAWARCAARRVAPGWCTQRGAVFAASVFADRWALRGALKPGTASCTFTPSGSCLASCLARAMCGAPSAGAVDPASCSEVQLVLTLCRHEASPQPILDALLSLTPEHLLSAQQAVLFAVLHRIGTACGRPRPPAPVALVWCALVERVVALLAPVLPGGARSENATGNVVFEAAVAALVSMGATHSAFLLVQHCPLHWASSSLFNMFVRDVTRTGGEHLFPAGVPWSGLSQNVCLHVPVPLAPTPDLLAAVHQASLCVQIACRHGMLLSPEALSRFGRLACLYAPSELLGVWPALLSVLSTAGSSHLSESVRAALLPYVLSANISAGHFRVALTQLSWFRCSRVELAPAAAVAVAAPPRRVSALLPKLGGEQDGAAAPAVMRPRWNDPYAFACVVWSCIMRPVHNRTPALALEFWTVMQYSCRPLCPLDQASVAHLIWSMLLTRHRLSALALVSCLLRERKEAAAVLHTTLYPTVTLSGAQPTSGTADSLHGCSLRVVEPLPSTTDALSAPSKFPSVQLGDAVLQEMTVHKLPIRSVCCMAADMRALSGGAVTAWLHWLELLPVDDASVGYRVALVRGLHAAGIPLNPSLLVATGTACMRLNALHLLGQLGRQLLTPPHASAASPGDIFHQWFAASCASAQTGMSSQHSAAQILHAARTLYQHSVPLPSRTHALLLDLALLHRLAEPAYFLWKQALKPPAMALPPSAHLQLIDLCCGAVAAAQQQLLVHVVPELLAEQSRKLQTRVDVLVRVTLDVQGPLRVHVPEALHARVLAVVADCAVTLGEWWVQNTLSHLSKRRVKLTQ